MEWCEYNVQLVKMNIDNYKLPCHPAPAAIHCAVPVQFLPCYVGKHLNYPDHQWNTSNLFLNPPQFME